MIAAFLALSYAFAPAQADVQAEIAGFGRHIAEGDFSVDAALETFTQLHPEIAQSWYQLGYVYFREHKIWSSVKALSKSLSINAKQPEAHKVLGLDFTILGRLDLAEDELGRALTLKPNSAEIQYHLGRVYYERGNSGQAARHLEQANSLEPGNVKTLHNLGLAYEALNQDQRARQYFQQALTEDEKSARHSEWPYINFASFLNRHGEYQAALDLLLKARLINAKSDVAAFELAKAYRGLSDWQAEAESMEKAVELDPRNTQYFYVLSIVYRKLGKDSESRTALARYESLKQAESPGNP
jgi:tetratricopeptide (TPR) repeat protein